MVGEDVDVELADVAGGVVVTTWPSGGSHSHGLGGGVCRLSTI